MRAEITDKRRKKKLAHKLTDISKFLAVCVCVCGIKDSQCLACVVPYSFLKSYSTSEVLFDVFFFLDTENN